MKTAPRRCLIPSRASFDRPGRTRSGQTRFGQTRFGQTPGGPDSDARGSGATGILRFSLPLPCFVLRSRFQRRRSRQRSRPRRRAFQRRTLLQHRFPLRQTPQWQTCGRPQKGIFRRLHLRRRLQARRLQRRNRPPL